MGFVVAYYIIVTAPVPGFESLEIGDRACQFVKDHDRSYFFPSNNFCLGPIGPLAVALYVSK